MTAKRLLRLPELRATVGLSRSTIYLRMSNGTFPKPVSIGGRLVAWNETDIQEWINVRINETDDNYSETKA